MLFLIYRPGQLEWEQVDTTEVVPDNLNPRFEHHFDLLFNFGQSVKLRLVVYDVDDDCK